MAARPRALTEADEAEWARFARLIVPLPGHRPAASVDAPSPAAVLPPRPRLTATRLSGSGSLAPARPGVLGIGGQPAGLDTATWQRFHRGKLGSTRKLDLHGMTAQHGYHALCAFLRSAHADRLRCVEIVTGRGSGESGVLRRELPLWLNLPDVRPMVLAATHPHMSNAMHSHGANSGSVRLLLRRPRP